VQSPASGLGQAPWGCRDTFQPFAAFQYLKGANRKDGENIFSRAYCNRTRSNGFKLRKGRFRLDIRKNFFTMRVNSGTDCPER